MAGYTQEEYERSQAREAVDPPKGSEEWALRNGDEQVPRTVTPDSTSREDYSTANTDTDKETPGVSAQQQSNEEAVAGTDRQIRTIKDWMEAEENRPETPEERKRRERREKSKRIVAAISDGLSALSNLYFTSRYAPNMYDPVKGSMTNAVDDRIERLKREREKTRDQYLNFSLKLGDLENNRARTLRELEAQQEARKMAKAKAARDEEQHRWQAALQPDKQREQLGKANKMEQEARKAQAEAESAQELQQAKLDTERARKGSYEASAANSRASASAHGRSNVSEFYAWDERGGEYKFRTKAAADAFAKQHGTWKGEDETETTVTSTQRRPNSTPQTSKATKTKTGGHAGKPSPTGKKSPTA